MKTHSQIDATNLEFFTTLLSMLQLSFKKSESLTDLVQYVVKFHVLGVVLVKLSLVFGALLLRSYVGVSPKNISLLNSPKIF